MNYELEKRHHISFCGSYCHLCDWHTGEIRKTFSAALHLFDDLGLQRVLADGVGSEGFRRGLESVMRPSICPGCKAEAPIRKPGKDRCEIRQCCFRKGLDLCSECDDFPCKTLETNPSVIKFHCLENLKCIRNQGLEHWIDREWERAA
jgi:hypothetical protein